MFWKKRSYESFFNQFFKMNRLYFDIKALIVYDRLHFFPTRPRSRLRRPQKLHFQFVIVNDDRSFKIVAPQKDYSIRVLFFGRNVLRFFASCTKFT